MQMLPEITAIHFCPNPPLVSAQSSDKYVHLYFSLCNVTSTKLSSTNAAAIRLPTLLAGIRTSDVGIHNGRESEERIFLMLKMGD